MLTSVEIRSFGQCDRITMANLTPLTVLAGRNGAGKSTIMRAIAQTAQIAATGRAPEERIGPLESDIELQFELGERKYRYFSTASYYQHGEKNQYFIEPRLSEQLSAIRHDGQEVVLLSRDMKAVRIYGENSVIEILADPSTSMLAVAYTSKQWYSELYDIEAVHKFISAIRYYPLDELNNSVASADSLITATGFIEWCKESGASKYATTALAPRRILSMHLYDQEKFDELNHLLGPQGLGLVRNVSVLSSDHGRHRKVQEKIELNGKRLDAIYWVLFDLSDEVDVPFEALSHGTRRVVDLVAAIIFDESSVMLVEHPEDGIHSALFKKVVDLMRSYVNPTQFIVSTHSPDLLNKTELQELMFVIRGEEGGPEVKRLTGELLAAAESYLSNDEGEGGSVFDFITSRQEQLS